MAIKNLGIQIVVNETSRGEILEEKIPESLGAGSSKIRRMMDKFLSTQHAV